MPVKLPPTATRRRYSARVTSTAPSVRRCGRRPLHVEQRRAVEPEQLHRRPARHLRRVGHAMEHRLPREQPGRCAGRTARRPARRRATPPRCGPAQLVQSHVRVHERLVDPTVLAARIGARPRSPPRTRCSTRTSNVGSRRRAAFGPRVEAVERDHAAGIGRPPARARPRRASGTGPRRYASSTVPGSRSPPSAIHDVVRLRRARGIGEVPRDGGAGLDLPGSSQAARGRSGRPGSRRCPRRSGAPWRHARAARPRTRPCSRCRRTAAPPRARPRSRRRRVELHRRGLRQVHRLARLRRLQHAEHEVLDVEPRDLHLRELQLDELELADRLAELHPFLRVLHRELEAPLDDAERHRGHAGAFDHERRLRRLATLAAAERLFALAEQTVTTARGRRRGTACRWATSAGPSCAAASTARGRACPLSSTNCTTLRSAGVALVELADEHDRVGVGTVGDERLRAVEHVLVTVAARG